MVHQHGLLLLLIVTFFRGAVAVPTQVPLDTSVTQSTRSRRKLHGRFLHITDMHPDPHYRAGMTEKSACHRRKPKKETARSGEYGLPFSECDSPFALTNYTLDYIDEEWTSEIDFVIWTGDSARHDNDRKLPRTTKEIYELNRVVARKMESVFTSKGIPVIPSIGNNDVWPHNIMMPGPNDVTSEFSSIWRNFVPFPSYQVFQRGGYYSVEVIPDSVGVISLNTMYFYGANKAVGGCEPTDPEDPGNLQFDWLDVQLSMFRRKGMQVWISGHVPPSSSNYFADCHVRYVELSLRFQDTIVGHLFGHMNADHFFFLDAQVMSSPRDGRSSDSEGDDKDGRTEVLKKRKDLYGRLLREFTRVHKGAKTIEHGNYAVVNVAPSVVPNPYLPSFRVFSYNITGTAYRPVDGKRRKSAGTMGMKWDDHQGDDGPVEVEEGGCGPRGFENGRTYCGRNDEKTTRKMWNSNPGSPSRRNRLWSPLGYAQYYMPNMSGTAKRPPQYKLEYMTFAPSALHIGGDEVGGGEKVWRPVPLRHLPKSLRNGTVVKSKYAPYELEDLTIPSWMELSRRLTRPKHEKLRERFKRYMYMGMGQ